MKVLASENSWRLQRVVRWIHGLWYSRRSLILIAMLASVWGQFTGGTPLAAQISKPNQWNGIPDYLPRIDDAQPYRYRTTDNHPMYLFVMSPEQNQTPTAAVVFFFGGGWSSGSVTQFEPHCRYLVSRGVTGIMVDYRVSRRHDSKIVDSVTDAFAAMDWIREHADELQIDSQRIVVAGGSAGGHLAACTGIIPRPQDATLTARNIGVDQGRAGETDLLGMVLFNPVISLTSIEDLVPVSPSLMKRIPQVAGTELAAISPYDQIRADQPPVLILHGDADTTVPIESVKAFQRRYREAGNRCELDIFADQGHGFFNYGRNQNKYFVETVEAMDRFLAALGVVEGEPQVALWVREYAAR